MMKDVLGMRRLKFFCETCGLCKWLSVGENDLAFRIEACSFYEIRKIEKKFLDLAGAGGI